MNCEGCGHTRHDPAGPLVSRACAKLGCYCMRTNSATGALMPPTPRAQSAEDRAELRRAARR